MDDLKNKSESGKELFRISGFTSLPNLPINLSNLEKVNTSTKEQTVVLKFSQSDDFNTSQYHVFEFHRPISKVLILE
jgi:hypothetical protein